MDYARLERRALREDTEELLEGAAGEREGDHRGVRPPRDPRGDPERAGRVPRRHDHAGAQPRREGADREGVRGALQGGRLRGVQTALCVREFMGY